MRGDQLARQWRVIRAIEASPNRLTTTEVAQREETGICAICRDLEVLEVNRFLLYIEKRQWRNRQAFIHIFKFETTPVFQRQEAWRRSDENGNYR